MRVGQIYRSAKSGNKARIILIDEKNDIIEIEWFWVDDKPCQKDKCSWPLSYIKGFVKKSNIQIYDELPKNNPNSRFNRKARS